MIGMQAAHLNAVISSLDKVLTQYLSFSVSSGAPSVQQTAVQTGKVSVMVGVTGDIRGEVILSMDDTVLKAIVGKMCGFAVEQLDDMAWSAFGEFGNWVGAACCTAFHDLQLQTNITPPVLYEGAGNLRTSGRFISVPVLADDLSILAHISLGE